MYFVTGETAATEEATLQAKQEPVVPEGMEALAPSMAEMEEKAATEERPTRVAEESAEAVVTEETAPLGTEAPGGPEGTAGTAGVSVRLSMVLPEAGVVTGATGQSWVETVATAALEARPSRAEPEATGELVATESSKAARAEQAAMEVTARLWAPLLVESEGRVVQEGAVTPLVATVE